jgi:hypothetical protein
MQKSLQHEAIEAQRSWTFLCSLMWNLDEAITQH